MHITLFTEVGKEIGFGHLMRCLSLCEVFTERRIPHVLVVYNNGDISLSWVKKNIIFYDWISERKKTKRLCEASNITIFDSYRAPLCFYKEIINFTKNPAYFDDYNRLPYPQGTLINGNIYAHRIHYRNKSLRYLLGLNYLPLRKEFSQSSQKHIQTKPKKIVITFGGTDSKGITLRILPELVKNFPPYLLKDVIFGLPPANNSEIKKYSDRSVRFFFSLTAAMMKRIMADADIVISGGGQTLYELACLGVPTVAIGISENQLANLKEWEASGFIEYAGYYSDSNLASKVLEGVRKLWSPCERARRSRIGQSLIDGRGSARIVDSFFI